MTEPTVTQTRYVIGVPSLEVSGAYYRDVLGFEVRELAPGWLIYTKGVAVIMAGEEADALKPSELGDHSYFAYLILDDVDAYYAAVVSAGATIGKPLRDEPWGMREFSLRTIDGHRIMFAGRI